MKRPKHCWWEFDGDGRFPTDRIKGYWKRHLRKWYLRKTKKQALNDSI